MDETKVSFQGCGFDGARFNRADLRSVDFSSTNLTGTMFYRCNLQGVSFEGADLDGGDLTLSDLRNANLSKTGMTGVNLYGAKGIYQFGPIGNSGRICFAVDWGNEVMFQIGFFWGTEEETIAKISEKYGEDSLYVRQLRLAAQILKENR